MHVPTTVHLFRQIKFCCTPFEHMLASLKPAMLNARVRAKGARVRAAVSDGAGEGACVARQRGACGCARVGGVCAHWGLREACQCACGHLNE